MITLERRRRFIPRTHGKYTVLRCLLLHSANHNTSDPTPTPFRLCYGLPIHRCRELVSSLSSDVFFSLFNMNFYYLLTSEPPISQGYHDRLFDLIDERPLTTGEVRCFCCLLFGIGNENDLPDPAVDLKEFIKAVNSRLEGERQQWNPIKKVRKVSCLCY